MIERAFYAVDHICSVRVHISVFAKVITFSVDPFPTVRQNCAVSVCISPEAIFAVTDPDPALLICKISISVKCVGISVRSGVSGIVDHVAIIDVVPVIVFPKPSVISGTVCICKRPISQNRQDSCAMSILRIQDDRKHRIPSLLYHPDCR